MKRFVFSGFIAALLLAAATCFAELADNSADRSASVLTGQLDTSGVDTAVNETPALTFPNSEKAQNSMQAEPASQRAELSQSGAVLGVVATLLGIVALIVVLAWLAKRMGGLRMMGVKDMQVISAMPVGAREKVAVIDVKGTQLLIGITPHHISHLHTFDAPVLDHAKAGKDSDFANKLQSILQQKNNTGEEESQREFPR